MTNIQKTIKELFDAKAHLGHKKNRLHPKAKKYLYTTENGVSVIDLNQTVELLEQAKKFVSQLAAEGKKILVVATKKIASSPVEQLCKKAGISYITSKWPAGLLTNFETITKNIKKLQEMRQDKSNNAWQKYVKHDRRRLEKELAKLEKNYAGIADLNKLPDAIYLVDTKKEKNVLREAIKKQIPIIAITDTNTNPDLVDYPIPANDDSEPSVVYITNQIVEAYTKTRKK